MYLVLRDLIESEMWQLGDCDIEEDEENSEADENLQD